MENLNEDEVLTDNQDNHVDPEEDGRTSPFADLCVAPSTASLWGRRIISVTTSDSAAFAVSELGEVRPDSATSVAVVGYICGFSSMEGLVACPSSSSSSSSLANMSRIYCERTVDLSLSLSRMWSGAWYTLDISW